MKAAGIKSPKHYIDKQTSHIPHAFHADIHKGGWNDEWKNWFKDNTNFTQRDLQRQIRNMMRKYNVPRLTRNYVRRHGKNGKNCGG
jgi:hypothetical protein